MPKGKPWSAKQEAKLRKLVESGESLEVIAAKMGKSCGAVREKAKRLGLVVVVSKRRQKTTTSVALPKELPSVEEVLKVLAGALAIAKQSDLNRTEVQRLQQLVGAGEGLEVIAGELGRSVDAVRMKARRLGLNVVVQGPRKSRTTTNELDVPEDLLSVQESLKILAAELDRSVEAVKMKAKRLSLNVVVEGGGGSTTTKLRNVLNVNAMNENI